MNGLLYAALAVSVLASSAVLALPVPSSVRVASQNSNSQPFSQNLTDQAPDDKSRSNLAVGGEETVAPKQSTATASDAQERTAQHQPEIAATPDRRPHRLTDSKTGCAALDINALPADSVAWSGRCVGGLASGPGTATFSNHGKFLESLTGDFDRGMVRDGHVAVKWADGSNYNGNGVAGWMEGFGLLTTAQGDRFQGQWAGDRLNGHGLAEWANGDRYEGEWRDGKAEGRGVQTWSDGRKYDGEWRNDLPNGHGAVTRKDGSRHEGEFTNGRPEDVAQIAAGAAAGSGTTTDAARAPIAVRPETNATGDAAASSQDRGDPDAAESKSSAQRPGIGDIAGKKLFAVDGSTLALTPIDGGLLREIIAPNGMVKKDVFAFLNDRQGTVSEGNDASKVTGVFRLTDKGIAADYSDGRSESLNAVGAGGVSITQRTPNGEKYCMAWYPEGHRFSVEERKAALAEYASRLGIDEPRHKTPKPSVKLDCGLAPDESTNAQQGPSDAPAARHWPAAAKLTPGPRAPAPSPQCLVLPCTATPWRLLPWPPALRRRQCTIPAGR